MEIVVIGLNHKSAHVELRERLAVTDTQLPEVLPSLLQRSPLQEAIYLSTCNRVEVYAVAPSAASAAAEIRRFLSIRGHCTERELAGSLYEHRADGAVRHLFRVASSLDSMMLGEPQILGQVKQAFSLASDTTSVGPVLRRLFQKSFQVAKRVRTETAVARNAVSLSFVAVELARKIVGDLAGKSILLIGAGKMAELSAKHLQQAGCREVLVANRSPERAAELAARIQGRARSLADLDLLLERVDVVISSTAATGYVVQAKDVDAALKRRRGRPLVMVDLAVPRDLDPALGSREGVYLFDVDDLAQVIEANLRERQREAAQAEKIVDVEVALFSDWLKSLHVVPTLVSLREKMQSIAALELERQQKALSHFSTEDRRVVESIVRGVVNKILHEPTQRLKDASDELTAVQLAEATRLLFQLTPNLQEPAEPSRASVALGADTSKSK